MFVLFVRYGVGILVLFMFWLIFKGAVTLWG